MNKLTSGLIDDNHKHKTIIFVCFSRICGGSSTIEAKHGHKDDFVVLTTGAPSVWMFSVI
jgi:hypothetical protein